MARRTVKEITRAMYKAAFPHGPRFRKLPVKVQVKFICKAMVLRNSIAYR